VPFSFTTTKAAVGRPRLARVRDRSSVPDQVLDWEGRGLVIRWHGLPFRPDASRVTQAYGLCFTRDGCIALVNGHGDSPYWNLAGGTVEPGETVEECLVREVAEEACARVIDYEYIGCQEVIPEDGESYFQTRFWALVELDEWKPQFEIAERALVRPDRFLATLAWGDAPSARELLSLATAVHGQRSGSG
jgi:8-oxo-dGTP pyrophosphatase MutT (NUDIX family)